MTTIKKTAQEATCATMSIKFLHNFRLKRSTHFWGEFMLREEEYPDQEVIRPKREEKKDSARERKDKQQKKNQQDDVHD